MSRKSTQTASQTLSIKQAAERLELSTQRVRSALKQGTLRGSKRTLEGTQIEVWATTQEAVDEYRAAHAQTNAKSWVVRLTPEQLRILQPKLDELGINLELRYKYDAEASKAYRERRKAAEADEDENTSDED
jgi:hypothetical protein